MPKLTHPMHLDMLQNFKHRKGHCAKLQLPEDAIYGIQWGNPDTEPHLQHVRDHYLLKYVAEEHAAIEIGPGGGRWTKYMLGFGKLYCVDYHQDLLDELRRTYDLPNMVFIRNHGTDFPGIPVESIDFLFSFGVFVHLDIDIIGAYLVNMMPLLKRSASVVIQYSDKRKARARRNSGFSENNPDMMRTVVNAAGYRVLEEDLDSLPHSSVIRFAIA